jgi:hypothetical protein
LTAKGLSSLHSGPVSCCSFWRLSRVLDFWHQGMTFLEVNLFAFDVGRRTTAPGLHFSFVGHQLALEVVIDQSVADAGRV